MLLLVDCSSCRTPLHLPPGATRIRCSLCHAFTLIAPEPRLQSHAPASSLPFPNSFTVPAPSPSIYPPPVPSPSVYPPVPSPSVYPPVPSPSVYPPPTPSLFSHAPSAPPPFSHVPSAPSPFNHAPSAPSPFSHSAPSQSPFDHAPSAPSLFNHAPLAPSPFSHAPPGPPPPAHGQKRAVIVGVSYKNTKNELKGCVNDANCMKFMLMKRFQFPESCILMLTEEDADPLRWPTRNNITMAMRWLVLGCKAGDSLVFHFSGHGYNQMDQNGDEVDGFDETLLPVDHATSGVIVDDEINATIVRPLPYGVKLHAIVDACHSGTVMDLPYLCRMDRLGNYDWEDHRPPLGMWKGTSGGEVFSFTGCDDDQTSADTPQLSGSAWTGAMTYAFIQAIERGHGTTYGSLLSAMRSTVHEIFDKNKGRELVEVDGADLLTTLLGMLILGAAPSEDEEVNQSPQKTQEPQLSATEAFDVPYQKAASDIKPKPKIPSACALLTCPETRASIPKKKEMAASSAVTANYVLKPPPYPLDALEPHMSKQTLEFHWGKHHRAYVDNLKKQVLGSELEGKPLDHIILNTYNNGDLLPAFNNAAQAWNHEFFWESMKPGGGGKPSGELLALLERDFTSYEKFYDEFNAAAATQFGAGWAWLAYADNKLKVVKTPNAVNPLVLGSFPLLTIDVWEHAYYLDFQNRRPDYIKTFMNNLVSWEAVSSRLEAAKAASSSSA